MFVHMYVKIMCVDVNLHAHTCGDPKSTLSIVPQVFETRSLVSLHSLISLDWLASKPWGSLFFCLPTAGIAGAWHPCLNFYMGSRDWIQVFVFTQQALHAQRHFSTLLSPCHS